MSSIYKYILIAILAAFASGQTSIQFQRCEERVITQCPCGPGGDLTDVYVDGCLVISNDSLPCQPCPGSCNLFLNCEKCSKHECLSCPIGKTGPTCKLLYPDDDSSAENNNSAVQNAEKSKSSPNATPAKIVEYGFDKPMPNVVALHLNKLRNSSFRPATDAIRPEIILDMIEFNVGNTSIVELIPENAPYVLKDNSTNMKENILDAPQICTTNCSNKMENQDWIGTEESNIDVLSNNETNFGNKIGTIDSQKNDTISAPFGEFHTLGDPLPPIKDSVNASSYKIQEFSKFLRQVLKKSASNERDQLELDGSLEQDLSGAYHQDYPENPAISSSQDAVNERQNKADSQNGSQPEMVRKTTAETKYVYISANEDNESKYPDSEYESSEQEQISGENLFHNTENNGPSTNIESDPAMDNVEQTNEEYSEVQKNGAVDLEKEQPLTSLDTVQQQNDQYFENHDHIHKPIPKDLDILKFSPGNPLYFIYFDPWHVMNPGPSFASPHSHMHYKALNTNDELQSFQKNRVPPLFNYLANMLRRHIAVYEGNRLHSEKNKLQQSQTMNMMKYSSLFNPADAPSRNGVVTGDGLQKTIGGISMMSLNLEPKTGLSTESVGQILIANVTHENKTDPRIVTGSVLTQDFEFEIPIPSLSADSKESKYLKKTDRSKYSKGSGRFRNLHTKRRRNGVKNDFSKCDPWKEDCTTLHGKIPQTPNRRKANHAVKSKTSRKDLNNLGYVRVRYVKDDDEPMYDSSEIYESSMSNENVPVYSQALEYDPQDMDSEMENFTAEYETVEASSEANSDSESNGRRSRRDIEATPFCPIPKDSRNGDLDCTIWSYKKTCTLVCHNGYSSPSRYFTCQRSKNTWVPSMVSCKGGPEYEPPEDTRVQLKQLDGNDYEEEEPQPPPRVGDDNKDYVESSSGEMGVRDQSGAEGEVPLTDVPIKTRAHKKKSPLNKEDYNGKSSVEMGGQVGDAGEAASKSVKGYRKKAHQNKVKKQDEYQKEVEDTQKVHKAQEEKGEPKQIQNAAENEEEWKEESGDDVSKTGSAEDQSAEESSSEEVAEAPKDEEIGHNDVDAEYED